MNFLLGSLCPLHQFWVQVHTQEAKATRVPRSLSISTYLMALVFYDSLGPWSSKGNMRQRPREGEANK